MFAKVIHCCSRLKYCLGIVLVLFLLPFAMFPCAPAHNLVGSLFLELGPWETGFVTISVLCVAWSVMFVAGLIIEDTPPGSLPDRWFGWLDYKIGRAQWLVFTAPAVPTIVLTVIHAEQPGWSALAAAAGAIVTVGLMFLASAPAYLAFGYTPFRGPLLAPCARQFARSRPVRWLFMPCTWPLKRLLKLWRAARQFAPRPCGWIDRQFHLNGRYRPAPHGFAALNFLVLIACYAIVSFRFAPDGPGPHLPAGALVYAMLGLAVWVLGALQLHLTRRGLSAIGILLLFAACSYAWRDVDRHFELRASADQKLLNERPTPYDVVRSTDPENLVVVASSGGGILATAWTTWTLHKLYEQRPQLTNELKLLSGVSGGAVGEAFFIEALARHTKITSALTAQVFTNSIKSSLSPVTYGLAFLDFPRLVTGGWFPWWTDRDRGAFLEEAWAANSGTTTQKPPTVLEFNPLILKGRLPAFIFGSTVMESGQRVMHTGMRFPTNAFVPTNAAHPHEGITAPLHRSLTLSEFYFPTGQAIVDLDLWTAARMSATFPYVTPVAKARFTNAPGQPVPAQPQAGYHLADGGYYDNFGISAALDWLDSVMHARLTNGLRFKRVLLVQLRAFSPTGHDQACNTAADPPAGGEVAALLGPINTLMAIYSAAARTRNDIAVQRFLNEWNARCAGDRGQPAVQLATVVFERDDRQGPLSWHLSRRDVADLTGYWPEEPHGPSAQSPDVSDRPKPVAHALQQLNDFLQPGTPKNRP